jgi:hypothetical protein
MTVMGVKAPAAFTAKTRASAAAAVRLIDLIDRFISRSLS